MGKKPIPGPKTSSVFVAFRDGFVSKAKERAIEFVAKELEREDSPLRTANEARKKAEVLAKDLRDKSTARANHALERNDVKDIAGGLVRGAKDAAGGLLGHVFGRQSELDIREGFLRSQADRYEQYRLAAKKSEADVLGNRELFLDTIFLGGNSLANYLASGHIPADVQRAYELQYPVLSANHSLVEEIRQLNGDQLVGLVSGVKGKLFELQYLDYLNTGHHLPDGYHALLAESATQPGWDIEVQGPDAHIAQLIQLKATDSVDYVKRALETYPHIDVTTTSEVQSHLLMQGMGAHVHDSGINNADLTTHVTDAFDGAAVHMRVGPPMLALAFVAWSSFRREDLEMYERSREMGDRGMQSWLSYLAGGAVAVATQTWWLALLGSVGTRLFLAAGRSKLSKLAQLDALIKQNDELLARMRPIG